MDEIASSNGIDVDSAINFVKRIEVIAAEIDEIMDRARADCEPLRQDVSSIKREAVDQGIGKRELAAVLKRRRLEAQASRVAEDLDIEQKANFEQMIEALERVAETMGPLGEAALASARAGA